jgi:8-oxo-dGTP diphosphatase
MADSRPSFTIGTFAIIFNEEGQVLLSHRRDMDAWNLPGGGLEPSELPDVGVRREVLEETGLEVVVERLVGVYGKLGRNELVFAFVCQVVGGQMLLTNEADGNQYFPTDQLPPNILFKHAERIWDALREDQRPVFRVQGGKAREMGGGSSG